VRLGIGRTPGIEKLVVSAANEFVAVGARDGANREKETLSAWKRRPNHRDPTIARFLLVRPVEAAASQRTVRMVLGWMLDFQDRSPR